MKLVNVFTSFNAAQSDLLRSRLEASGFTVNIKNEYSAQNMGTPAIVGGFILQVPEDQAEDARTLIESVEADQS